MEGYKVLAAELQSAGVDVLFGVMGEGNIDLIFHWVEELGLQYVAARHESAAVMMAHGYARTRENVGVCAVTHGPGLTNAMTALISVARDRSPVVLVAGDLPHGERIHSQVVDQLALVRGGGVDVVDLAKAAAAGSLARRAIRTARARPRTVVLNAPVDVQSEEWAPAVDDPSEAVMRQRIAPDEEALATAVEMLAASTQPLVVAGIGAVRSGAKAAIEALAEHLGAGLATSLQAKDWFRGHELDLGISGGFSGDGAQHIMEQADCVLVFGASLNVWTTRGNRLFEGARIIQCDQEPAAIGQWAPVDPGILGDARTVAEAILPLIKEHVPEQVERRSALREQIAEARRHAPRSDLEAGEGDFVLDGASVARWLDNALPEQRALAVDSGHFVGYPCTHVAVPQPAALVFTAGFGSIGLGLGAGIGAAFGRPEVTTVAVVGDGGLMMSVGDLETAARHRLRLLVLVMNDSAYGMEIHVLRMQGRREELAKFPNVSFEGLAESLGIRAVTVRESADLALAAKAIGDMDGPLLVDAHISYEVMAPWVRKVLPD